MILGRPKNIWKNLQNPFFLERSYSILAIQTIKHMIDFLRSLTREEIELVNWLGKCTKGSWEIGKDGLVNVFGSFDCSGQDLKDFKGVKFGIVTKDFDCDDNNLTSLEGAPKGVGEDFNCSSNKLTSLKGAPKKVGGDFSCEYNKLTSLKGAPREVGDECWVYCQDNKLTSLEGIPQGVKHLMCDGNPISEDTLGLIHYTMVKHKVPYVIALGMVKNSIKEDEYVKLSKGLINKTLKGASLLGRSMDI